MYAYISDNDKQESKVLSNLLKITINFWTVWAGNYVPAYVIVCYSLSEKRWKENETPFSISQEAV